MRVEIPRNSEPGTVEVWISKAPANVPRWLRIRPANVGGRFETRPEGHVFEEFAGEVGPPGKIVDAARRFLGGEADQANTEAVIEQNLTEWSRATQ